MTDPWTAERVVDLDLARVLIENQFPDLAPLEVQPFGQGWDNTAFLTTGSLVFRFPRRQIAVALMETEIRILPRIAPHLPVAIPVPRWVGRPDDRYPWPFSGYSLLPGQTADRRGLGERERRALARPLGEFLAALHANPPVDLEPDTIGRLNVPRLSTKIRGLIPDLATLGLIDDPGPALDLVEVSQDLSPGTHRTPVHGDLYARHLILSEADTLAGVIDWGDLHVNDPAADLSIAWSFLPPSARDDFRRGYGTIDASSWRLARLRALHYAAVLIDFGRGTQDAPLIREGTQALGYVTSS
jgi:aminoglycoside phosphotransferase (APT) family kinase protein